MNETINAAPYCDGYYEEMLSWLREHGFANISFKMEGNRLARDVCPANIVLNRFAGELGLPYDQGGKAARSGNLSARLFEKLNALPHYARTGPGSLSREWLEAEFLPLLNEFRLPVTDILSTLTEHIAFQVSLQLKPHSRVLVTVLRTPKNETVVVPNSQILSSPVTNYSTLAREQRRRFQHLHRGDRRQR